jgi:hypothetical protein
MTPQLRSRQYLEARGWTVATVEALKRFPDKHVPPCRACGSQKMVMVRTDLYGFGDILAFNSTNVMIVQATDRSNMSKRWAKIRGLQEARLWCSGPEGTFNDRLLVVHGWYKKGRFWEVKEKLVTPEDFEVTRCSDWDDVDDSLPF